MSGEDQIKKHRGPHGVGESMITIFFINFMNEIGTSANYGL